MSRCGTVFRRVLVATLIPFALLFAVAWFLLGQAADDAGMASGVRTLLVMGGALFALLVVCVFVATRAVVRPIRRIAERADAMTGDDCEAVFDDVPIRDAPQEVALLRDALIRMSDSCVREDARKLAILQTELERVRQIEFSDVRHKFFTNVSNKIRAPMNAIVGITERLLNDHLEESQAKYVDSIKMSTELLLSEINDILDLSKMESGAFSLENDDYDFGEMLALLREQTMALVARKPLVVFEMSVDESVPVCLYGDEARMQQMLMNLLSSVAKSTNRGFVRFHARADENNLHFDISGSDAPVWQDDPSARFDPTRFFSDLGGDDLGLAISRFLAVAMDGSIRVESEYGKSTTFRITVPKEEGDIVMATGRRRAYSFKAPKARVLVVDDDEANLDVAAGILSLYEISCDRAISGREAIDLIRRNDYDIVFMDLRMPGMDGVQTTGIIRSQGGAFEELPIIAITTSATVDSPGFSDMLTKPIDMERLRALLLKWLPEGTVVFAGERVAQESVAYTRVLEAAAEIGELDVAFGLDRVRGQQDLYEHVLKMTLEKAHLMASALVTAASHGDFDSVRLHAHAAKESLSDIGATRLAILAADLERAAEAGDMAFCRKNTPGFIDRLGRFVEALSEVFVRVPAREEAHDWDALARIREAIASSDFEAALAASSELAAAAEKSGRSEKLRLLRDALEHFDYDSAIVLLDKIQGERRS